MSIPVTMSERAHWPELLALQAVGTSFHQRGWSLGTSSNYSVVRRRNPLQLLITASGKDKGDLKPGDFVLIDSEGRPWSADEPRPSAETLLHTTLAELPEVGAVLHTHSVWGTLLSRRFFESGGFPIEGYEMLKGLAGVTTHVHRLWVRIFDNTQDIPALAREVRDELHAETPLRHVFLIRGHGMYTWGRDLDEARRHVEVLEFLFEIVGRSLRME
jgi:methylthioribulose-1-phosphate dehydratase